MIDTSQLIDQLPYPGLFITLILGSLGLPLPEEATLILCGYLISRGAILPLPGVVVVYCGVLTSDFIIFTLGRRYGRRILQHRFFNRILSPDRLSCLEERFIKIAPFLIIFGRHLFGLRTKIIFMSSLMGIPPRRFLFLDAIAASISVSAMVLVGYSGGNWIQNLILENLQPAYPVAIILTFLVAAYFVIKHLLSGKRKSDKKDTCPSQTPVIDP